MALGPGPEEQPPAFHVCECLPRELLPLAPVSLPPPAPMPRCATCWPQSVRIRPCASRLRNCSSSSFWRQEPLLLPCSRASRLPALRLPLLLPLLFRPG